MNQTQKRTCRLRGDSVLDEAGELLLVSVFVLLHQVAHVLRHVDAHDVLAVDLSVKLFALRIVAREALGAGVGEHLVIMDYRGTFTGGHKNNFVSLTEMNDSAVYVLMPFRI